MLPYMLYSSPAQFAKTGSWAEFAKAPSGTGPFKITEFKPRISATLSRNEDYWDKNKVPKLDKMILFPMPEATTRLAALRSGQVDWIEVPPPDAVPSLKGGRLRDRHRQLSACLAVGPEPRQARRAVGRRPGAAGAQLLHQSRWAGQLAERSGRAVGRHLQADRSLFRQAQGALYIRPRQGQGAAEGGRLRPGQAGQGQGHDLDQRLGPDAAAADERVPAAERQGVRFRHLVRGRRLGRDAGGSAQHADRAAGDGRPTR